MTELGKIYVVLLIAACANLTGITCSGTGRIYGSFNIVVSGSSNLIGIVAIAACTNVCGVACLSTGRSNYLLSICVTGSSIAFLVVGFTTSTSVGGVTCLSTGRSVIFAYVVMNVLSIGILNYALCIEGNLEEIAADGTEAAPVALISIPLKVQVTADILKVVNAITLIYESPLVVYTGSVKGGLACCKSELLAVKSGEGVGAVFIYGYYPNLVVGCICKVFCAVINALVVVGACGYLKSGKELSVRCVTDKNTVAGLKLGNKCPIALNNSRCELFTALALAVNKVVAESRNVVRLGIIAVSAGICNNTVLSTCGRGGNYVHVLGKSMAGSLNRLFKNIATSLTGLGKKSVLGTGCLYGNLIVVVAKLKDGSVSLIAADGTSDNVSALRGTGSLGLKYGLAPYVVNAGEAGINFATLALAVFEFVHVGCYVFRIDLTALALTFNEVMLVGEDVLNAGNLTDNVLNGLTRGESEKHNGDCKHDQHQSF